MASHSRQKRLTVDEAVERLQELRREFDAMPETGAPPGKVVIERMSDFWKQFAEIEYETVYDAVAVLDARERYAWSTEAEKRSRDATLFRVAAGLSKQRASHYAAGLNRVWGADDAGAAIAERGGLRKVVWPPRAKGPVLPRARQRSRTIK